MARNGLPPAALERVRQTVMPAGRVVRVRPLRGGVSSSVHLVRMRSADGAEEAVVVRRYGEYWQRTDPAACEREFRLLSCLSESGFPSPRPILLERDGGPFGAPTVVMSRLPGRPECTPRDLDGYLVQLANTLARLHALPTTHMEFMPDQRDMVDRSLNGWADREITDPLHLRVIDAAKTLWPRAGTSPQRTLLHGDYWPGNILFRRGKLVGVVDWEQPRLGEPTKDVATCRGDLTVLFGESAADRFLDFYVRAGGQPIRDLQFWELLVCTWAIPEMPVWAKAYRVLKRPELTSETATAKIRDFAESALRRADQ